MPGALSTSLTTQFTRRINSQDCIPEVKPRVCLLDALREDVHLTGIKTGCNQGACGACTVLCDGKRTLFCFVLPVQYAGPEVTTIESLRTGGALHFLQTAFVEHYRFQCRGRKPEQICSAIGMMKSFAPDCQLPSPPICVLER